MEFVLFLVVNAILFVRPGELVPGLEAWPIYNYVILANLVVAAPSIINYLSADLGKKPATVCVLGLFVAFVLSHVARFDLWTARYEGFEFAKVIAYYLLLVSVVTTQRRFVLLLVTVTILALVLNVIAVLQYHDYLSLPSLTTLMERDVDEFTGEVHLIPRMRATGIFNDPNDLSMIIVAGIIACGCGLFYKNWGASRFALLAPIGFLLYALTLTQSRGGLLALGAGAMAVTYCKWGRNRALQLACLAVPAMFVLKGRQTDIAGALSGGTGQARVELWSEGLQMFKNSPVFGAGAERYAEEAGQVAHNSFVHCFAELGLLGGGMFLGLFLTAFYGLWRMHQHREHLPSQVRLMLPFVAGLFVAYCVSMLSLSRSYVVPTYLMAGLIATFGVLGAKYLPVRPIEFNGWLVRKVAMASVMFLMATYLYIKVFFRML